MSKGYGDEIKFGIKAIIGIAVVVGVVIGALTVFMMKG